MKSIRARKFVPRRLAMIIGNDKKGVWIHRSSFDNPNALAAVVLTRLLRKSVGGESYAAKPQAFALHPGEDLYRRRCQDCHTIGAGDAIGPDLLDVTQNRERAWLERYLREPNKVLAEKDPIAMALHDRYSEVLMPNLRLSDSDIAVLVGYMEEESRKVKGEKVVPKQAANAEDHSQHQHHHH